MSTTDLATATVLYCRKSTREDGRQAQSLGDQEAVLRREAEARGLTVVRVYKDQASGADANRPGFREMIERAEGSSRDFSSVLVYDVSRFGRFGPDELGRFTSQLRDVGVLVHFLNIPDGRSGGLMRSINGYLAEEYSASLARTTLRGMVGGAQVARWQGGTPPFGFDLANVVDGRVVRVFRFTHRKRECIESDPEFATMLANAGPNATTSLYDTVLVPSTPERVAVVRRMFELAASGLGLWCIAQTLNDEGRECPMGKGWNTTSVNRILNHRAYLGDFQWGRTQRGKFQSFMIEGERATQVERETERGKHRIKPKGNIIVVPNQHEGIISPELWEAVQRARAANKRGKVRGKAARSEYLLSGLLECGQCGRTYTATTSHQKSGSYQRYECGGYKMGGKKMCAAPSVSGTAIHEAVVRSVADYLDRMVGAAADSGALDRKVRAEVKRRAAPKGATSAAKKRAALDKKVGALARRMAEFPDLFETLVPELTRLKAQREQLGADAPQPEVNAEQLTRAAIARGRDLKRLLTDGDVVARKGALRQLLAGVRLDTQKGTFVARVAPILSGSSPDVTDAPPSVTIGEVLLRGTFRIAKRGRRMGKGRAS